MSYSFNGRAATKAEAKVAIAAEFDKVVAGQPIHKGDRDAAQAAAFAFVDILEDNDQKDYTFSCYGSVSYNSDTGIITNANMSATAGMVSKELPLQ